MKFVWEKFQNRVHGNGLYSKTKRDSSKPLNASESWKFNLSNGYQHVSERLVSSEIFDLKNGQNHDLLFILRHIFSKHDKKVPLFCNIWAHWMPVIGKKSNNHLVW